MAERQDVRLADCYKTLELPNGAARPEVHAAYKRLAMKYHPDRAGDHPDSRQKFIAITRAYAALQDALREGHSAELRPLPECAGCGKAARLYAGMDRRDYCVDCLLHRRRRLLPRPPMVIVRCVGAVVFTLLGGYLASAAWLSGNIAFGLAALVCGVGALSLLSLNVLTADEIR